MKLVKLLVTTSIVTTSLFLSFYVLAENKITVWAWNINVPVLEKAAVLYQQTHPDAKIDVLDVGKSNVYTKLSVGLQAKGAGLPDVMLIEDGYLQGYLENWPSAFVNLSKLGYDQYASEFPQFKKEVTQIKGQFYGMPFDVGPVGVFYRPSYFAKAGVDPKSIQDWDDYIAAGKKIKDKTGASMVNVSNDDADLLQVIMNQQGVYYFDKDGNIDFNNPKVVYALSIIDKMNKAGVIYTGAKGWDGYVQAITAPKIVAIPAGAWLTGTIETQAPKSTGDWAVFPLPKTIDGKNAANVGGSDFVISSASKNIKLAYDFMSFFTTNIDAQTVAFKGGLFPSYLPTYKVPVFNEPSVFFNNQTIWTDFAKVVPNVPATNYTLDYAMAREEAIKAVSSVMFEKGDPKTALAEAAKRLANRTGRTINKYE